MTRPLVRFHERHRPWIVWRHSALCDAESRDRVADFYGGRVEELRGAPRALANVLEQIELCTALVQAQRTDAFKTIDALR